MTNSFLRRLASRTANTSDPSLREVLQHFPGVISFAGGLPDASTFDMARIKRVAEAAAQDQASWQYTSTEGWKPLRSRIAELMSSLGIEASWDNILITNGSQHALDLLGKTFVDPGDTVLIEQPGYLGAIQTMLSYEAVVRPIAMDEGGIIPEQLSGSAIEQAKLIYSVTSFQNPTGATLSPQRRKKLLDRIVAHNGLLVEDAAYYWLAYDGPSPQPVAAMDRTGRVIFLGSFSKVLLPGVRIGWIVAPTELIEQLALLKQSSDLATNTFGQVFVYTWLQEYGLQPSVEWYRKKRDEALRALQRYMPDTVTWNKPGGGFFIWITLPQHVDSRALLTVARQNGVTYVPGSAFGAENHTLRFSFSETPIDQIDEGVKRLAKAIKNAPVAQVHRSHSS